MKKIMMLMMIIMLVSLFYMVWGNMMHAQVTEDEATFHNNLENYFNIDKVTRDSASANSALSGQLVEIKKAPSNLLRLKLIGVGRILTGIYALLFGILIALILMPIRLGMIIKGKG